MRSITFTKIPSTFMSINFLRYLIKASNKRKYSVSFICFFLFHMYLKPFFLHFIQKNTRCYMFQILKSLSGFFVRSRYFFFQIPWCFMQDNARCFSVRVSNISFSHSLESVRTIVSLDQSSDLSSNLYMREHLVFLLIISFICFCSLSFSF